MSIWEKHQFKVEETEDGSPTLRCLDTPATESMHHSGGAFSESVVIYGKPLFMAFQIFNDNKIHVGSIGLGLGYNELLTLSAALQNPSKAIQMTSFESNDFLKSTWIQWVGGISSPDQEIYNKILSYYPNSSELVFLAQKLLQNKNFQILGALENWQSEEKINVILYDAFSSQTSPELWSEEFLTQFLEKHAADECLLTTYACTGNLKRALKKNNFQIRTGPGFKGKRESTLAYRNLSRSGSGVDKFFNIFDNSTFRFGMES